MSLARLMTEQRGTQKWVFCTLLYGILDDAEVFTVFKDDEADDD